MEKRKLGWTELDVTVIGIGGIPLMRLSKDEAARVVRAALDEGINFVETARGYRDSEEKVGEGIKGRRDECILCTRTGARDRERMLKHIDESLRALGVDYIDIYQVHGLLKVEQLEQVMAPNGALEALKEAQEKGKIRHIGVTGHKPDALVEALKSREFSNVQLPFNFIETEPLDELIPLCRELNVGIIVMKPLGGGVFKRPDLALRWLMEQPVSTISIGMDSVEQVKGNVQLAEAFTPLTDEERAILQREAEELGKVFCRRCEYCQPCPAKIPISSILMLDMFRVRDGLDRLVTVFNAEQWLERAEGCEDCGACEERCPYGLPIRDLIRQYTERYRPLFAETKQRLGLS